MKTVTYLMSVVLLFFSAKTVKAQLYPVNIAEKVSNAALIVEGKVVTQQSFWNDAHTNIFTSNTIELYKSFKGSVSGATIEVLTQGGVVGNQVVEVSDLGQLTVGDKGIFFLYPNSMQLSSPASGRLLYDIYASDQGIMRYSIAGDQAYCPYEKYNGITSSLYSHLETLTGKQPIIINNAYNVDEEIAAGKTHSQRLEGTATITSTSPAAVNAGAVLDPINNILTINGTGFGNSATNNHYLLFKDGDNDFSYPTFKVDNNSPYLISWSNTVIKVNVPSKAANGKFGVYLGPGDTAFAPHPLKVNFSVLNAILNPATRVQEPRLTTSNATGGYNILYSTSTANGGANFTTSPVYNAFRRALTTWKETVGANFTETGNTSSQSVNANFDQNIIMLDNTNTGFPVLAAGVLAVTYSYFDVCSPGTFNNAQKTGFDMVIRNQGVSAGTILFENGPCPPAFVNPALIDMETVLLHELGHVLNLAHVNDPQEVPGAPFTYLTFVNPAGVMNYQQNNYSTRRSPDESAYNGALYTTTSRGVSLGFCLAPIEMIHLPAAVPVNDNCPLIFPTAYTTQGTTYNIDLVHATSSKSDDPQFTAASCSQPIAITNNIYQVIRTSYNGTLDLTISNYTTTPTQVATASCDSNQGVKISIYDVATCPNGQSFPPPMKCLAFTGNGIIPTVTGLGAKKTYLLFVEGVRNTKATFTIKLAGTALASTKLLLVGRNVNENTNELQADIEQDVDLDSVTVERSTDGINFEQIGQLFNATGLRSLSRGNGSYSFTDASALHGTNYYRLKKTDIAGISEYSAIIALKIADKADISMQPNPFHGFVNVTARQSNGRLTVVISDAVSRRITQTTFSGNVQISTASLARGTYLVSVYDAIGQLLTTKKMMKD